MSEARPFDRERTLVARQHAAHSVFLDAFVVKFENKTMAVAPDIYAEVASVLTEALVVEKQGMTPKARLQRDLGADSLDLLEITFRLEHAFGIEIPRGELFPDSTFRLDPELLLDGNLTDKGIAEIHSRIPYADLTSFKYDRRLSAVPDLFTVGLVADYVAWKLGRGM
jgi:acyl carrier protein